MVQKILLQITEIFYLLILMDFLDFEKNICDKYLTWNKLYKDKKVVKLPPIQFEKYKNIKEKKTLV